MSERRHVRQPAGALDVQLSLPVHWATLRDESRCVRCVCCVGYMRGVSNVRYMRDMHYVRYIRGVRYVKHVCGVRYV